MKQLIVKEGNILSINDYADDILRLEGLRGLKVIDTDLITTEDNSLLKMVIETPSKIRLTPESMEVILNENILEMKLSSDIKLNLDIDTMVCNLNMFIDGEDVYEDFVDSGMEEITGELKLSKKESRESYLIITLEDIEDYVYNLSIYIFKKMGIVLTTCPLINCLEELKLDE